MLTVLNTRQLTGCNTGERSPGALVTQESESATSLSSLPVKSVGLPLRARASGSGFHFIVGSFTYMQSGKWPASPWFPEGLVGARFCSLLLPLMKGCWISSTYQHQILTWAVFGFECALLSLFKTPLKRQQEGQCIACTHNTRCANLPFLPPSSFHNRFPH